MKGKFLKSAIGLQVFCHFGDRKALAKDKSTVTIKDLGDHTSQVLILAQAIIF